MFWRLKVYAIGAAAIAASVGAMLLRIFFLQQQRDRLQDKAERLEAQANRARIIARADQEAAQRERRRRSEVKNEIDDTGDSSAFRDPSKLWDDD